MSTILACDDNPVITEFIENIFSKEHEVITATNGEEALACVKNNNPDLIIIDVMMPVMDGITAIKTLRSDEEFKFIPIIMLTALGKDEDIVRGLDAGADDYMEKPFNTKVFMARVRAHLRAKSLYDQLESTKKDIATTLNIVNSTTSKLAIRDVLKYITDQLAGHLNLDRSSIILVSENDQEASVIASSDSDNTKPITIDLTKYPEVRSAIQSNEPVFVQNTSTSSLLEEVSEIMKLPYTSLLVVPIIGDLENVGKFILTAKIKSGTLTDFDQKFCQLVAAASATAIKNAYLYEDIEAKNKSLKELDRLKSNFVAMASHELRTPVNIISGYLEMLYDGTIGELTEEVKELIKQALDSCQVLTDTVTDMLDLSVIESGELPLNLQKDLVYDLLVKTAMDFQSQAEQQDVSITVDDTSTDCEAYFDKSKISQVLANLVTNSLKFTESNGTITLSCANADKNTVQINVSDTGTGIKEEDLGKVFEEFYTTGGSIEGTGLGLPICKKIIEKHNGSIKIESTYGKGSKTTITLPKESSDRTEKLND
ncbi:MAG: response regulator, partial [Deltaproteobacteria bacterium]|nr:response regulator [Deltaproteobacteria bacterium]